ncbi:type II toxin-antitoxin system RelE/ParE family toxin [Sulfurospirillum sp. MES]|uniref:type II toxin-antitoxin system RelE family toxin n=1 Tax=Sulfurospirillum sp. MES TaxID=1565314 RepID=UPI0025795B9E|nr:type II toxin-antitoxin system RelE/ParE family toxin [Sulfurospirillum sp. MES]
MKISFSKTFEKSFSKYDHTLQKRIYDAIVKLPEGDVKRLAGDDIPPLFRLRVSKYRILFYMDDIEIKILKVDSRGDIYK